MAIATGAKAYLAMTIKNFVGFRIQWSFCNCHVVFLGNAHGRGFCLGSIGSAIIGLLDM